MAHRVKTKLRKKKRGGKKQKKLDLHRKRMGKGRKKR